MRTPSPRRAGPGFTLIELMVTLAIIAVLGVFAVPGAEIMVQRTKEQDLRTALREIRGAIDAYKRAAEDNLIVVPKESSGYPPTLDMLAQGVRTPEEKDAKKGGPPRPVKLYFLRRVPRDPMSRLPASVPAADTWAKRSYASEPDHPAEGEDVYDVYSRSEKIGLNGVPYAQW